MPVFFAGVDAEYLVLLILIETQVAPALHLALFVFESTKDQASVFCSFVVDEDHTGALAVRMRILLASDKHARRIGLI